MLKKIVFGLCIPLAILGAAALSFQAAENLHLLPILPAK